MKKHTTTSKIKLSFRSPRPGPESDLVDAMLSNLEEFIGPLTNYEILIETYAEIGVPDILLVKYDTQKFQNSFIAERRDLSRTHLKVLHHIWSFGKKGKKIEELINELGYSERDTIKACEALERANLLKYAHDRFKVQDRKNAFFIDHIISIEAKISNVKKAIEQAFINLNYASHSYVLMPHERITKATKERIPSPIGLLAQQNEKTIKTKAAKSGKIPSSYFSWVINEYIGQKLSIKHV